MYTYKAQDFQATPTRPTPNLAQAPYSIAVILAVCTILIRLPNFGDPTYHVDEAFYLFVGQNMHQGLSPYADIWDRKPAGLFFLFAIFAQFGGVYAYQAFAALFAWGTALTLALIATRFAGRMAACATGVLYLAMIGALAGGGGQSPVFYNLFIALAAFLVAREAFGSNWTRSTLAGEWAMLLCGLALTVKPTALAEGIFLGLLLLGLHWRSHCSARSLMIYGARLVAMALAPTVLIWAYFYAAGHLSDYWFATMQSIFLTRPPSAEASAVRLMWLASILWLPAILAVGGLIALARRPRLPLEGNLPIALFVGGWLFAAIVGFVLIPNFYDHYALPLAAVLALASAPRFDRPRTGPLLAIAATAYLLITSGFPAGQIERKAASQAGFQAATEIISRHAASGCIFVYDATSALYLPFTACPATKYAFPEHLSNEREAGAIGADPVKALEAVLKQVPAVIVIPVAPSVSTPNLATRRTLQRHLIEHYEKAGEATLFDVVGRQRIEIWARSPNS